MTDTPTASPRLTCECNPCDGRGWVGDNSGYEWRQKPCDRCAGTGLGPEVAAAVWALRQAKICMDDAGVWVWSALGVGEDVDAGLAPFAGISDDALDRAATRETDR